MISEPALGALQTSLSSMPDYHQAVFDMIPLPVFVVDNDVVLQDCNAAAGLLLSHDPSQSLHHRAGEALHCLHANDVPEGCGRGPSCSDCVLRRSVQSAFRGEKVARVRAQMELKLGDKRKLMQLLITSSPFDFANRRQVVVVVGAGSARRRVGSIFGKWAAGNRMRGAHH